MTTSHSKIPSKKKKVKKEKPIPENIRERALSAFQKLRRLECANEDGYVTCISCGVVMHWKDAQGGHYIKRQYRATELDPDNVNPQCPRCNNWLDGAQDDYRWNLRIKIGEERVLRLERMKHAEMGDEDSMAMLSPEDQIEVLRKKGKVYYKNRYEEYKARIKELSNE